jgi:formamidopyrimidine-DNA glycosylase
MPELPEAETVARQLARYLTGERIAGVEARVPALRGPVDLPGLRAVAVDRTITGVRRRGKFIFVDLDDGGTVMLHLGMTGTCRICPPGEPLGPHEHVVFRLVQSGTWRFVDPRRFGMVVGSPVPDGAWLPAGVRNMGPEPLEGAFDAAYLHRVIRGRKQAVKTLLMDQRIVAGIGNIYASEILFRAGIRPGRGAGRLTRPQCDRIVAETRAVLSEAIELGGTTIDSHTNVDGSMGRFVLRLQVYGRDGEPCKTCNTPIKRTVQGGRSTFYCPNCQPG